MLPRVVHTGDYMVLGESQRYRIVATGLHSSLEVEIRIEDAMVNEFARKLLQLDRPDAPPDS